jgi:hypothetical protein
MVIDWSKVTFIGMGWTPGRVRDFYYLIEELPVDVKVYVREFRINPSMPGGTYDSSDHSITWDAKEGSPADIVFHEVGHHLIDSNQIPGGRATLDKLFSREYIEYLGLSNEAKDPEYKRYIQDESFASDFQHYCFGKDDFMSAFNDEFGFGKTRFLLLNEVFPYRCDPHTEQWWKRNLPKMPPPSIPIRRDKYL